MKREIYYWIVLIIVILAAALYVRFNYHPQTSVMLNFTSAVPNSTIYQYQKATLSLQVSNLGPTVRDLPISIIINGNLTSVYNVSLSQGKGTIIEISHTFSTPGGYNFTAEADPAKLYDLANRNKAISSEMITVLAPATPSPQKLLPGNSTGFYHSNMTSLGYEISSYMDTNYSVDQMQLSNLVLVNNFMYRLFRIGGSYIANFSSAGSDYNGSKGYSMWFDGYLEPSVITAAAQAENLTAINTTAGNESVTMVTLSANTTLCSWYSSGWIKTFSWQGNATCAEKITTGIHGISQNNTLGKILVVPNNSIQIGDFYKSSSKGTRYGKLVVDNTSSVVYYSLWKNFTENHTCYGLTDTFNTSSYCSVYLLPNSGVPGNTSLIRTTEYIGNYNISIFSLTNSSTNPFGEVSKNIYLIQKAGLDGKAINFTDGITNTCSFTANLNCSSPTFGNSSISFNVTNDFNDTVKLNAVGCFLNGIGPGSSVNKTIQPGRSAEVIANCYNDSKSITAIPLNLQLRLFLNYTENNASKTAPGGALIVI